MYKTHFGFHRRPFPATPDDSYYYPASTHEKALLQLERALRDKEGLVLLTGEAGSGKTLLCHCLLNRLPPETNTAFLTNSHFEDRQALLQALLYDFSLPHEGHSIQELRLRLTDFLLENAKQEHDAVVILDEAHHLTVDLLEELRLLTNLEAGPTKAVQLLLSAQPPILQTLALPEMTSLNQRLAERASLEFLDLEESIDYLMHHIRLAGVKPHSLFSMEAVEFLAQGSQGIPRFLNQIGHHVLAFAYAHKLEQIDEEVVFEVLVQLGLAEGPPPPDNAGHGVTETRHDMPEPTTPRKPMGVLEMSPDEEMAEEEQDGDVLAYRLYKPPRKPA